MFNHNALKLVRSLYGLTLDEIAEKIGTSRQYVHSLENGKKSPTFEQITIFCTLFGIKKEFFYPKNFVHMEIDESEVHFRKLRTTKQALKIKTISRLRLVTEVLTILENELNLPKINFPEAKNRQETGFSRREIEYIAEKCREAWGFGLNPISNMVRVAENNGAFVLDLDNTASDVDALSIFKGRPVILRNTAKQSTCRKRFDIAHEIGHFILHRFISTGDTQTEQEANMFASAFLLPEKVMLNEFPRPKNQINWQAVSDFKLKWKVSKAACFYRAHKLGLLTDSQYKSAVITLRQRGESIVEKEDYLIPDETPDMIYKAIELLGGVDFFAKELFVDNSTVSKILSIPETESTSELLKIIKFPKKQQNA